MYKTEDLVAAAEAIQTHLPGLLGDKAETVTPHLKVLLVKAKDGEDVEIELLDLLTEHEPTRAWMQQALEGGNEATKGERGFSPLAGNPQPPKAIMYVCDTCGETEPSPKVLATPPVCKCGKPMKLKS